jgi:hypothetical protein
MWNWFAILGLIFGPFYVGVLFEDKLRKTVASWAPVYSGDGRTSSPMMRLGMFAIPEIGFRRISMSTSRTRGRNEKGTHSRPG